MSKFPLDLSKFKKIHSAGDATTLRHNDGHEIKVMHKPLSKHAKKALEALPIHESEDPTQRHALPGDSIGNSIEKRIVNKTASRIKMPTLADGGQVSAEDKAIKDKEETDKRNKAHIEAGEESEPYSTNVDAIMKKTDITSYADGGDVQDSSPDTSSQQSPQAPVTINIGTPSDQQSSQQSLPPVPQQMQQQSPQSIPQQQEVPQSPQMQPQSPQPQSRSPQQQAPMQDIYGTGAMQQAYGQGLQEQKAGIVGQAEAEAQQGNKQAALYQQAAQQQQQQMQSYADNTKSLMDERQALLKDINNSHIDPNHYLSSQGTGSKIATAIGLIMGGMGGGLTHSGSAPLQFLSAQIDRDIQAQQAELGKKQNLLSANLQQFGNLNMATQMTKLMQMDIISNQLKRAAAQTQDPLAKARALQAAGQIDMQAAPIQSQIAMRQTLMQGASSGKIAPEHIIRAFVPEKEQMGAQKELKEAQGMSRAKDNILGSFDKVAQLNTIGNRLTSPLQTRKQVNAIVGPLVAGLSKETAGRFTEQDAHMIAPLFPAPGDSAETTQLKRTQLAKLVQEKMNFPLLQSYGINPSTFSRFGQGGQNKIQESAPQFNQGGIVKSR